MRTERFLRSGQDFQEDTVSVKRLQKFLADVVTTCFSTMHKFRCYVTAQLGRESYNRPPTTPVAVRAPVSWKREEEIFMTLAFFMATGTSATLNFIGMQMIVFKRKQPIDS